MGGGGGGGGQVHDVRLRDRVAWGRPYVRRERGVSPERQQRLHRARVAPRGRLHQRRRAVVAPPRVRVRAAILDQRSNGVGVPPLRRPRQRRRPGLCALRRKRGEKAGPEPGKPPPPTHRNQHQHKSYDPTQFLLPLCGPCGAPRLLAGWPGPAWARSRKLNNAKGGGACMHPGGWWWQFGRQLYMSTR